jgi:hypothetical protein
MPKKTEKSTAKKVVKTETKKVVAKKLTKPITKDTKVKPIKKVEKIVTKKDQSNDVFGVKNILAVIGIIVLLLIVAYFVNKIQPKTINKPAAVANVKTFSYDCPAGKNALDALKSKAEVTTQDSSVGVYVSSINNIEESDGNYWLYYINDQPGTISPDKYNCASGDKVEWRLEQLM